VAIVSRNSIDYPVALMAASRLGAIVTLLPSEAKSQDLAYYFRESSTKLVFSDDEALGQVRDACKAVQLHESRILPLGKAGVGRLVGLGNAKVKAWTPTDRASSTCAFLAFTSGTTGKPKAVRLYMAMR
jgi:4-coumarate--CoA ligase